ncbi:Signal transduction histidine kinase [Amycolatopsis xylanica]|uniref:histidine kinase n=1 Tax=Amycolatopsis xylanica TaxID=589385 RepID=A0A1H2SKI8_9PSEU|nr:histidine kinase [Amycolatopsis xylanica]SDW32100.1 Signal transduction histidine kinase [Amycolatopsis xylanica]
MTRGKPRTAREALTTGRFLLTAWPWRAYAHFAGTPVIAAMALAPLAIPAVPWLLASRLGEPTPWISMLVLVLAGGLLLAAALPWVAVPVARLERRRLRLVDDRPLGDPPRGPVRYGDPATWRAVAYLVLLVTVGAPLAAATCGLVLLLALLAGSPYLVDGTSPVSLGFTTVTTTAGAIPYAVTAGVVLVLSPYPVALLTSAHGAVARALLRDDGGPLRAELVEVGQSRARLVDLFEAERRRVERDLHDGAQQRLVALTLRLGLAKVDLPSDSPAYAEVAAAHDEAKDLMTELRELVRGIHPRVLTDLGLPAALGELADRAPVPVSVRADLPGRLPAPVEAIGYFVVAEALTNVAKHSGATQAGVSASRQAGSLVLEVSDDGVGGADPAGGTGLTGLADRAAVVGGRMFLSSPPGGPTVVRVELPCP